MNREPTEYGSLHMKITKISDTEELVEIASFTIKRNIGGICTQCRINGTTVVNLGQKVFSNGRFGVPDDIMGLVVKINLPGDGRSSDIIDVWFEGEHNPLHMKFKDLHTERLAETAPR